MHTGEYTVMDLFDGAKIFNVPIYQRAYSWDPDPHLQTFIEDIEHQPAEKNLYLGTVLLQSEGPRSGFSKLFIVDGQQRLTTLVILISRIIDKLQKIVDGSPPSEKSKTFSDLASTKYLIHPIGVRKFNTVTYDNDFLWNYVLHKDKHPSTSPETPSQRRLLAAKDFFSNSVFSYTSEHLNVLLDTIDKAKVLVFSVEHPSDATQIFELNNDRGKRLTELESIKSFLMHSVFLKTSQPERQESILAAIQEQFGNVYRRSQQIEDKDTSLAGDDGEDRIFQYHWRAFENWTDWKPAKQLLKTTIRNLKDEDVVQWIEEFVPRLVESFYILAEILEHRDHIEPLGDLYAMKRVANFYPLMLKAYRFERTEGKDNFKRVLALLDLFAFRSYEMGGMRSDAAASYFNTLARDFEGDFNHLADQLRQAFNIWNIDRRFQFALDDPHIYQQNRDAALFLLWKYENHLRSRRGSTYPKITWRQFLSTNSRERLTVEHIAAQSADDDVTSSHVLIDSNSDDFRDQFLHNIGNLVIDSHSANSSKGKNQYLNKEQVYKGAPFMSQNELHRFLEKDRQWDQEAIEKRKNDLVDFALNIWNPLSD